MEDHQHIALVNESQTDWIIKVRATRIWAAKRQNSDISLHHLILLDCQNNHVSATVRPDVWELFRDIFREGGLYLINKMVVRPAFGYYRPVSSEKRIILLPSTVVTVLSDDGVIPDHKFKFVPLQDLNPFSVDPIHEHTPLFSPGCYTVVGDGRIPASDLSRMMMINVKRFRDFNV
ncbi:hypothetical protein ACET3Z_000567 [Daucus carota]